MLKELLTHPPDFLLPFFSLGGQFSFFTFSITPCFLLSNLTVTQEEKNEDVNSIKNTSLVLIYYIFPSLAEKTVDLI